MPFCVNKPGGYTLPPAKSVFLTFFVHLLTYHFCEVVTAPPDPQKIRQTVTAIATFGTLVNYTKRPSEHSPLLFGPRPGEIQRYILGACAPELTKIHPMKNTCEGSYQHKRPNGIMWSQHHTVARSATCGSETKMGTNRIPDWRQNVWIR